MDFNFNEIVIDRPLRAHKYNFSGQHMWTATQIQNLTLELGGETVYAVDAVGANIMPFDRSKSAAISFENALMHLGVLASQRGMEKNTASATNKLKMTVVEMTKVTGTDAAPKIILAHTPYAETEGIPFKYIDKVDANYNTIATYELGATATEQFSVSSNTVTLPTDQDIKVGDRFVVKYKYETEEGLQMTDTANVFGQPGEFIIEALCYNPCDKENKVVLNIIFPNGKEDNNVSLTVSNELTHPVTVNAMQEYCSEDKALFRIEMLEN